MLFIDEITNTDKLKKIFKFKNKFLKKIENKSERISDFLYKLIFWYMCKFHKTIRNSINIEEDGLDIRLIYLVYKRKITEKIGYQLLNIIKRDKTKRVILSNTLNKNDILKNVLYSNNIDIIDGKLLYESLVYKMIEYISVIQKRKMETYEISVLINDKNEQRMFNISKIITKCRVVNIITNNTKQFDKLKNDMKKEYGILVNVTTNIEKSLLKSDIIINFDFVSEIYSKCNIPKRAIVFNISENIKIHSNNFEGINITDYMIYVPEKYK